MIKEFLSNFIKIKNTPFLLIEIMLPFLATFIFFLYYGTGGAKTVGDVRLFFILLQIVHPLYISLSAIIFTKLDRAIYGMQTTLGITTSRTKTYLGRLLFQLFFCGVSILIFELCFFIGTRFFIDLEVLHGSTYLIIFLIFIVCDLFLISIYTPIAYKFGSSITILVGIIGMCIAGFFENEMGKKIWYFIPWEWGIYFLKIHFGMIQAYAWKGIMMLAATNFILLILTLRWFKNWEGLLAQE